MERKADKTSTRRRFLAVAGGAIGALGASQFLVVRPAKATPASMAAAIREAIGEAQVRPGKIKLDLPPLVENGNTVPLTVIVDSPMTAANYVKRLHIFNEKNPQPQVATFFRTARRPRHFHPHPACRYAEGRDYDCLTARSGRVSTSSSPSRLYRGGKQWRALITVLAKTRRPRIEIKTLFSHPSETGYRPDFNGKLVPRDIINRFCLHL